MLARRIIEEFDPNHNVYCEPFGYTAAVLFAKEPCKVEAYNDLDERVVNFFMHLRNPRANRRLARELDLTPYHESVFRKANDVCKNPHRYRQETCCKQAYYYYIATCMSFSGTGTGFSRSVTARGGGAAAASYRAKIRRFDDAIKRLANVQFDCDDFERVARRYDSPTTQYYFDPPYFTETGYRVNFDERDHARLSDLLQCLQGSWVMTAPRRPEYAALEKFIVKDFNRKTNTARGAKPEKKETFYVKRNI